VLEWQPTEGAGSYLVLTALQPDGEYRELGFTEKPSYQAMGLGGRPPVLLRRPRRCAVRSGPQTPVAEAQN